MKMAMDRRERIGLLGRAGQEHWHCDMRYLCGQREDQRYQQRIGRPLVSQQALHDSPRRLHGSRIR
jgi:hypothetical protein